MQLFEYAIIVDEKRNQDGDVTEEGSVVVPITSILARDSAQATMLAARAIPEKYTASNVLDRVKVAVRPF